MSQSKMASTGAWKQVCEETQALFALSKGVSRVQIEFLAPAWFNRFGDPLKSARVMEIITLLLKKPGFATYRYQHVWAVAPDPNGGYLIADHANKMAALDKGLPKRDRLTYHGVFRKTHLATALLIIKLGTFMWPGTQTFINADNANPDLLETLRLGMHCLVWEQADVVKQLGTFKRADGIRQLGCRRDDGR